jgi:hypothetical protein
VDGGAIKGSPTAPGIFSSNWLVLIVRRQLFKSQFFCVATELIPEKEGDQ